LSHIKTIRRFFFKNGLLLILAGWFLTFSYLFQYYWSYTSAPAQVKKTLQRTINNREKDFEQLLNDTALLRSLNNGTYSKNSFQQLIRKDYFIFVASNGSDGFQTRFWNTQTILPGIELWQRADGVWFEQLINGYYTVYKKAVALKNGSSCLVMALIPVKWNYFVTTNYLSNGFAYLQGIEKYYSISDVTKTTLEIKSNDGTTLFWLKEQTNFPQPLNWITVVLRLVAMFCLLLFLHKAAAELALKRSFAAGLAFLVACLLLIRSISYFFPVPLNLRQFNLFDPAIYGSNNILKSLGDLLLNSFLLLWVLLFIRRYGGTAAVYRFKVKPTTALVFTSVLIFSLTILFGNIVRSLVADSQISFNVTNFFSLSVFSFAGFCVLGSLALNYFLLIDWLFGFFKTYTRNNLKLQLLSLTIIGLVYITATFNAGNVVFHLCLLGWLLLIVVLLSKSKVDFRFLPSGGKNIFWLFFFSISLTFLLITENAKKEWSDRLRMAEKLSLQTDPSAENLLRIALDNFRTDFLADNFYRFTTSGSNQFLKDSLLSEHFSGYLNKFQSEIFTFNFREDPLYNADSTSFNTLNIIYKLQGKPTTVKDWQYYEESFDKFYYIAKKEISDPLTKQLQGYVFIISRPKRYADEKFDPQLFSKTFNLLPESMPSYAYAVYKNKELISSFNDYPFPVHLTTEQNNQPSFSKINKNGYSELWYMASSNLRVVIAKPQNKLLETITLFAYLFCVFLMLVVLFRFIRFITQFGLKPAGWKSQLQFTFRTQVHTTIIGISVFSFLVIGASTIFFFINRHSRINKERLSRTIQIMQGEVENALSQHAMFDDVLKVYDDVSSAGLQIKVNRISEIHGVDVNIYDPNGNLKISSQPYYYSKGLLSRKADPAAYFKLSREYLVQTIEDEKVGTRSYMSIYVPVRDGDGKTYAYLNIPYFTSQDELKQEISNFLVTLINLNAFIFLIAGLIAFFVTGRITSSFSIISDKMKEIKLGKSNEVIVWDRNDEIGELVQEYNKMVKKLEESASLLARSEREGAWREMARQVAHEIKNPLTPMKLSIQYLQKAVDSNSPDTKDISQRVAKTLVEQIDYLSNIASDFSSFANIGNPRLEKVNLAEALYSVVALFSMYEEGSIEYEKTRNVFLMADKTQLNRLFTNLLRNALESASDDKQSVVKIDYSVKIHTVLIRIQDNGEGVPLELQDKIFYPNFTTKTSGTGLGLAMCKSIVEQMKGHIWFETEQGKGSTFFVELPVLS